MTSPATRVIVLDSFPTSCMGKNRSDPPSLSDLCRKWVIDCLAAGNRVVVPGISYYETLRELERLGAPGQIERLKSFCFQEPARFLPIETAHLEMAAKLWARSRNAGLPTASPDALDGDVILAAQALSLGLPDGEYVVATTNVAHLSRFVACEHWQSIEP